MIRLSLRRALPAASLPLAAATLLSACTSSPPVTTTAASSPTDAAQLAVTSPAEPTVASAPAEPVATGAKSGPTRPAPRPAAPGASARTYRKVTEAPPPGIPADEVRKTTVPPPPASFKLGAKPRVRMVTNKGTLVVELNPKAAPLHARSFAYLSSRKFYDGTTFHRWADLTGTGGTIIQGGDPFTRSAATRALAGAGGPGYEVPRERNSLKHDALVLAAARTADPDSAGSQFYITQAPTYFLDTTGGGYTVFGRVVQGADVAKKLRQEDRLLRAQLIK